MTERTRALLINALVFPGAGQLLVQRRRRVGSLLFSVGLAALLVVAGGLVKRLSAVVSGLPPEVLLRSPWNALEPSLGVLREPGGAVVFGAVVLAICWLWALVDSLLAPSAGASPPASG